MAVVLFSVVVPDTVKLLFIVVAPVNVAVPDTDKLLFNVATPVNVVQGASAIDDRILT